MVVTRRQRPELGEDRPNGDLTEAVLLAAGIVAMPAWLIRTARLMTGGGLQPGALSACE